MNSFDYPLLLEPISVPKVWAGGKLARIPGRGGDSRDEKIGESWDVSTWPSAPDNPNLITVTRVINGSLAGKRLDEVAQVPVVVKVIDSGDRLSVQNHPNLPDKHKNEMWYILEADPNAYLYMDLADGITADEFCRLLKTDPPDESKILGALHCYSGVGKGACFTVPAPTVHALGPGLLTFEISERSQTTYRLYDYNRPRSRGKLDIEPGCAALTAPPRNLPPLEPGIEIEGASSVELTTQFATFCVFRVKGEGIAIRSSRRQHLVSAVTGNCRISGPTPDWDISLDYTFTTLVPPTEKPYTIEFEGGEILISPLGE